MTATDDTPRRPMTLRRIVASGLRRARALISRMRTRRAAVRGQAADRRTHARTATHLRLALRSRRAPERLLGTPHDDALAVVVCLWNRPHRIGAILTMLDRQESSRRLRLILWNNQPRDSEHYRDAVRRYHPTGRLDSVEFLSSPHNIGGIARFVAMRHRLEEGYRGPFLMLDDDQDVSTSFVSDLLAVADERTVAGLWAWRTGETYWERTRAEGPGEPVDYVGTGGSVCDAELVAHDEFFTSIPPRFIFLEDMWMSWLAAANGWRVISAITPVEFVESASDQYHSLIAQKNDFYDWLRQPGNVPRWTSASASSAG